MNYFNNATVHIGLELNIEEADYSVIEGETENTVIKLQFRRTQNPFTVTVYPVNITQANKRFNVGSFFTGEIVDDAMEGENTRVVFFHEQIKKKVIMQYRLSPHSGEDFTDEPYTITVPATQDNPPGSIEFVIPENFEVIDDEIDEIEQSFALVAEIGEDVPEEFTCFQRQVGDSECFGRRGATEIKIVDNDGN